MRGEAKKCKEGFISMDVLLKFKRLMSFVAGAGKLGEGDEAKLQKLYIAAVLRNSENGVVVKSDGSGVRRANPLPEKDDSKERTAHIKGIAMDATLDTITAALDAQLGEGKVKRVQMRFLKTDDGDSMFKGSARVEFDSVETMKKIVASGFVFGEETLKSAVPLSEHLAEKQKQRDAKKMVDAAGDYKKGCVIVIEGLSAECDREALKGAIESAELTDQVWAEYHRGDAVGHLKFRNPEDAQKALKVLVATEEIAGKKPSRCALLEGETELRFYVNSRKNARKRKGQGGRGGYKKRGRY
jgi:hypothetical protein